MTDCLLSRLTDGRLACSVCGWESRRPLTADVKRVHRECPGVRDIAVLAAVCLTCPYLRDHERAGLRCTHRNCRCGQGEQATVELAGHIWNGGLINRLRAGRCPDGRW